MHNIILYNRCSNMVIIWAGRCLNLWRDNVRRSFKYSAIIIFKCIRLSIITNSCSWNLGEVQLKVMVITTSIVSDTLPIRNGVKISKEIKFALCSYCFWCASFIDQRADEVCPLCRGSTINSIPLVSTNRSLLLNL